MHVVDLALPGAKLIQPVAFQDERGFFLETYRKDIYAAHGIECEFVQDNHSFSKKGTLRGMHFQSAPGQAKLVSVIQGKIFDVVVDIRPDSPFFGKWQGLHLDGETHQQLFIPVGFAHGFCAVSDTAHVLYKVSNTYNAATEKGFRFDDPDVGITWPEIPLIVSARDLAAPFFKEVFS
jgi:dTDP-4-dehydrorhamnose 3,5-epimerase